MGSGMRTWERDTFDDDSAWYVPFCILIMLLLLLFFFSRPVPMEDVDMDVAEYRQAVHERVYARTHKAAWDYPGEMHDEVTAAALGGRTKPGALARELSEKYFPDEDATFAALPACDACGGVGKARAHGRITTRTCKPCKGLGRIR